MPDGIVLTGFKEFADKIQNLPASIQKEADFEVQDAARYWVMLAKQDAPVNHGVLRNGITMRSIGLMNSDVYSNASYSAYVEWGTGAKVSVPAELADYALGFKGQKQVLGMKAHPFFFVQMPKVEQYLKSNITNNILQREH